jgi:hypothetical protein
MHAADVLKPSSGLTVAAAYLPFWLFEAEVSVTCRAALGYRVPG